MGGEAVGVQGRGFVGRTRLRITALPDRNRISPPTGNSPCLHRYNTLLFVSMKSSLVHMETLNSISIKIFSVEVQV